MGYMLAACLALGSSTSSLGEERDTGGADVDQVVALLTFVIDVDEVTAAKCLRTLREKIETGEIRGPRLATIKRQLSGKLTPILKRTESDLYRQALFLSAAWGDKPSRTACLRLVEDREREAATRAAAAGALAAARDPRLIDVAPELLTTSNPSSFLANRVLAVLSEYESTRVAQMVLQQYSHFPPALQGRAIEVLTQRTAWSTALLHAVGDGRVPRQALHASQVAKLLASKNTALVELVRRNWGSVRTEKSPLREQVIQEIRIRLERTRGNAKQGQAEFHKICGQCHRIHGTGQDVGPDITRNGRSSFEQLLSNVLDPNLVIGAAYQARTVVTTDGRVLAGLVVEDNPQRIVLKIQGGKREVIPRGDIEELQVSRLSLMPEGVENQLPPQQLANLFAFLTLDRSPFDPEAKLIPGTPATLHAP